MAISENKENIEIGSNDKNGKGLNDSGNQSMGSSSLDKGESISMAKEGCVGQNWFWGLYHILLTF